MCTEDLFNTGWKYAGGDHKRSNIYFKLNYQESQRPKHKNECICLQRI